LGSGNHGFRLFRYMLETLPVLHSVAWVTAYLRSFLLANNTPHEVDEEQLEIDQIKLSKNRRNRTCQRDCSRGLVSDITAGESLRWPRGGAETPIAQQRQIVQFGLL
jgi:hypothetical protein